MEGLLPLLASLLGRIPVTLDSTLSLGVMVRARKMRVSLQSTPSTVAALLRYSCLQILAAFLAGMLG